MSINFGQLKTNIGNRVQDTSTAFATIIGYYINHRYRDILRRTNWNSIVADYTFTATSASTIASASTYTLPSDFGKELYVYNQGTEKNLVYVPFDNLSIDYVNEIYDTGTLESYTIFDTKNTSATSAEASAARVKKIKFVPAPSTDNTIDIPYIMRAADLSGSTDELVLDCEMAIEYGATADAWLYKRQFSKARDMEGLYEKAIQSLLWDKEYSPNRLPMMGVEPLDRDMGI